MLASVKRLAGTSLVELLVSMAIGLASLSAMSSLVGHGIALNSQLLAKARLDEELDAIVALLINDIRRTGYSAGTAQRLNDPIHTPSPFSQTLQLAQHTSEASDSCILYAYDRNQNGLLDIDDTNENYGFRLHDGALEMRLDGLGCEAGGWQDISDPNTVNVTFLQFSLQTQNRQGLGLVSVGLVIEAELVAFPSISRRIETGFMAQNYAYTP
jgi:prepilin peptidase dependent protein B